MRVNTTDCNLINKDKTLMEFIMDISHLTIITKTTLIYIILNGRFTIDLTVCEQLQNLNEF